MRSQNIQTEAVGVVKLYGKATIGGTGAVDAFEGSGFTLARDSAGLYTCTLTRPYSRLLFAAAITSLATATEVVVALGAVDMTNAARTAKLFFTTSGSVAELASGTILYIELTLGDSSVRP